MIEHIAPAFPRVRRPAIKEVVGDPHDIVTDAVRRRACR